MTIVPVLLYHAVADDADDPFAVSPARFAEHVRAIADSGRTALTISALASALRGEADLPRHPVAITFDDGYRDTRAATELLAEAGVCSTVYVSTGAVGRGSAISAADVAALAASPHVELGAHTINHVRVDELDLATARMEIIGSKRALEDLARSEITTFAYPHGAYDARSRGVVIEAGFTSAAAVKNALSHAGDDPWAIARSTVMGRTAAATVRALLSGTGAPVAWSHERVRTRMFRTYRRGTRRVRSVVR